jgi:hypothetical protein
LGKTLVICNKKDAADVYKVNGGDLAEIASVLSEISANVCDMSILYSINASFLSRIV